LTPQQAVKCQGIVFQVQWEMELMATLAGVAAPPCATMLPDKCTATEDSTMAARWEDTVHGHMETALQCAALTAIMMPENITATWEQMIMDAGWATSALQKNAQQEHTEDKLINLTTPRVSNVKYFERSNVLSSKFSESCLSISKEII